VIAVLLLAVGWAVDVGPAAASDPIPNAVSVRRGRPVTFTFTASQSGEALLDLKAWSKEIGWRREGAESAVLSISVDGVYATDLVVLSRTPLPRRLALGHMEAGVHELQLRLAEDRSSPAATKVKLTGISLGIAAAGDPDLLALRHAPVLYGRSIPVANAEGSGSTYAGPFQNAVTDTPLLAWHEILPAAIPGNRVIEYSVVWSNEDGGTNSPALMARWGRSTDIEWVYRVEVDPAGNPVPGTAVYQGPNHMARPFEGASEGNHPLLQTCTSNNMVCDDLAGAAMRFFLSTDATRPSDRAREVLMDQAPWTYAVMAAEMVREGKVESPSKPATPELGNQRSYLYVEVDKDTVPPNPPTGPWVGLSLGVRLAGDPTVYRSDHLVADWSIKRDDPAATTVELPPGTAPDDVVEVIAYRVPVGAPDTNYELTVTAINRAFFLDDSYAPQASFIEWRGSVTLSPIQPSATLWAAQAAA